MLNMECSSGGWPGAGMQQHVERQVTVTIESWDVEAVPQLGCRGRASVG